MNKADALARVKDENALLRLELALLRDQRAIDLELVYAHVENRKLKRQIGVERRDLVRAHVASQRAS